MRSILDFSAWAEWFHALDAAWLFVPILVFVIVVVRWWSRGLRRTRPVAVEGLLTDRERACRRWNGLPAAADDCQ